MLEERKSEIRLLSRAEQKTLLDELRWKNSMPHVPKNQPIPMRDAKELVANDEEIEFLEKLLADSEE